MDSDSIIGRQFANFRILRHLGHGGMADVYLGHDVQLQRSVAVKVLDARHQGDRAYAKRFVREAQAVASWRHENIIQVYYAGEEDGYSYFVMEYIDGRDLGDILSRKRKLMPHDEVLRIGRAVAGALDYAHQQGVVHRDVKPSNVMIAKDGRVVLMDFGLALDMAQGSVGEVFGSANYISPEQARNSADGVPQSDLYSLGVMLYELLVGKLPFEDPSFTTVAIQPITAPPPPPRELNPELNPATERVLLKALHKSPDKRYRSAGQLLDALEKALQALPPAEAAGKQAASPAKSPVKAAAPPASATKRPATRATRAASATSPVSTAASADKRPPTRATAPAKAAAGGEPPAGDGPGGEPQPLTRQIGLVAGGVIMLLIILVLILWLFSSPAGAAGPFLDSSDLVFYRFTLFARI